MAKYFQFKKSMVFAFLFTSISFIFSLFIVSVLVYQNSISDPSIMPLLIATIIISVLIGVHFIVSRSGNGREGILFSCILTIGYISLVILLSNDNCINAASVKTMISVFVGTLLGNFSGKTQHNRLRYARKKTRNSTK